MGKKKTTEDFIEQARQVHGNKYDYSKVDYVRDQTKVCIICPEHGEFWQRPGMHIRNRNGCPECFNERRGDVRRNSIEEFVERADKFHAGKYD